LILSALRRLPPLIVILNAAAAAQVLVDPSRLPSGLRAFETQPNEVSVRCEVSPVRPALDYGFRFGSGYITRVPLGQYPGGGHRLAMLTRITPEDGGRKPAYFVNTVKLPVVPPQSKLDLEMVGGYLLGPGKYSVEWVLLDEKMRVCRKKWRVTAALHFSERKVKVAIPPGAVADYSLRGLPGNKRRDDGVRRVRLTVLMHAAPLSFRRTTLRASDKMLLMGTLSSLLDRVPARSLRLVVFNLDQQKEIFRKDTFSPESLEQVTQSLNELELGSVDYKVLLNRKGHVDLLAELVNQEVAADTPSDQVVFLGAPARFVDKVPPQSLEKPQGTNPRFFYLQLRPFFRTMTGALPDSIALAVSRLKGKTLIIHTPGEFSNAIDQIERSASAEK
jgi:hypothetical protein